MNHPGLWKGGTGILGTLACVALEAGGAVIGVMPWSQAEKGMAFDQLNGLRVAKDLHKHKTIMAELGDGFIALPGGLGTLEDFFEILAWAQLGIHHKPSRLLNVNGYFDKLVGFMDYICDKLFITPPAREQLLTAEKPDKILELFMEFSARNTNKSAKL